MDKSEIVLQLTLSAIENKAIDFVYGRKSENDGIEEDNAFAAKQIADFYNSLLENLKL